MPISLKLTFAAPKSVRSIAQLLILRLEIGSNLKAVPITDSSKPLGCSTVIHQKYDPHEYF
jgi:hypothetical protein